MSKKTTKKTRAGTLTAILIFVILCIFLTTMSNGTVYYTENGFTQPESDIRWLPSLQNSNKNKKNTNEKENNLVRDVISQERMDVIHKFDDIKQQVKETHHGEPYFHILSEVDLQVGSANKETVEETDDLEVLKPKGNIVESEFQKIINISPLVLFYESSHEMGVKIKTILMNEYDIYPEMTVVDLDKYFDKESLLKSIRQKTYGNKSPLHSTYLFLKGKPIVDGDLESQFMELHSKDHLMGKVNKLGKDMIIFQKIGLPSNN